MCGPTICANRCEGAKRFASRARNAYFDAFVGLWPISLRMVNGSNVEVPMLALMRNATSAF